LSENLRPLSSAKSENKFALDLAITLATVKLAIHLIANSIAPHLGYGFFRDELYFIDCGHRLAWGYVDQTPMVALQARVGEVLLGKSLIGMRALAALAGSATIILSGLLTWALGGTRLAQAMSMTVVLLFPFYLAFDDYLSMNSFEPLFWMTIALVLILMAKGSDLRLWIVAGFAYGLGLENKPSIIFFLVAAITGLALSPQRNILRSRWALIALGISVGLALPNVIWQIRNGWPTWYFLHNPDRPIAHHHFLGFIRQQLFLLNVTTLFVGAGLIWLLFSKAAVSIRFLAYGYFVFFVLMFTLHARTYYLAPYYPVLIAAGAIAWDSSTRDRRWILAGALILLSVYDLAYAPMSIPLFRPARYIAYRDLVTRLTGLPGAAQTGQLEQWYSDKIGWPEMVRAVARVYWDLPASERSSTAILAQFYGDASAIDVLGPAYGLPQAISGNQNFWLWGPRQYDGSSIIAVGFSRDELPPVFTSVVKVGDVYNHYSTPYENRPIFLCRGMSPTLQQYWPRLRHWR
jgi:hypothetical protein